MGTYTRRLPHWDFIGQPQFVTFRLHGSLPAHRKFFGGRIPSGRAFAAMDRLLDHAREGPFFLRQPEIAQIVKDALIHGDRKSGRYRLHSWVIMPNHVHLLATPIVPFRKWLGPLKGFTAHEANRVMGRTGLPFWQAESYDHWVRDDEELERIQRYIAWNPVKAGMVYAPEEWIWSSVGQGVPACVGL